MEIERLVKMANDISRFFEPEPDHAEGVRSVASHITRFWDPRMRLAIIAHLAAGGDGLSDLSRAAVATLVPPAQRAA